MEPLHISAKRLFLNFHIRGRHSHVHRQPQTLRCVHSEACCATIPCPPSPDGNTSALPASCMRVSGVWRFSMLRFSDPGFGVSVQVSVLRLLMVVKSSQMSRRPLQGVRQNFISPHHLRKLIFAREARQKCRKFEPLPWSMIFLHHEILQARNIAFEMIPMSWRGLTESRLAVRPRFYVVNFPAPSACARPTCAVCRYRGTSLIRNSTPLRDHHKTLGIVALSGRTRGGVLMSEVPL